MTNLAVFESKKSSNEIINNDNGLFKKVSAVFLSVVLPFSKSVKMLDRSVDQSVGGRNSFRKGKKSGGKGGSRDGRNGGRRKGRK